MGRKTHECEELKERFEVAQRNHVRHSERRSLGDKPFDVAKGKAQKLGHSRRWFPEPRSHRWLSVGSFRQVGCVWVVSGAA